MNRRGFLGLLSSVPFLSAAADTGSGRIVFDADNAIIPGDAIISGKLTSSDGRATVDFDMIGPDGRRGVMIWQG